MWPLRIENSQRLINVYGNLPELNSVEITFIDLSRDGPSARVGLITQRLPFNPPTRWGKFNAVLIELLFFEIFEIEIRRFSRIGISQIDIEDIESRIFANIVGAVEAKILFRDLFVMKIDGLLRDSA